MIQRAIEILQRVMRHVNGYYFCKEFIFEEEPKNLKGVNYILNAFIFNFIAH